MDLQQEPVDNNIMLSPSSIYSDTSKEVSSAALLVPPAVPPPDDDEDDKTPTIKNHKTEAGPFGEEKDGVDIIISIPQLSEGEIQPFREDSIQSEEIDITFEAINNDNEIAPKTTKKDVHQNGSNDNGKNTINIHNDSEKSLIITRGVDVVRKEEQYEDSIGQASHRDTLATTTYNDSSSNVGDQELIEKAICDDEITTQEPMRTGEIDEGNLQPKWSDRNSCQEQNYKTSLLPNNNSNTMMEYQHKDDTDYFSNSDLGGGVKNPLLDQGQHASKLNLEQNIKRSDEYEDKGTKDGTNTVVNENFESREDMPAPICPNDALAQGNISPIVNDIDEGFVTKSFSDNSYSLVKQDVQETDFISKEEESWLQDYSSISEKYITLPTTSSAEVINILQDKGKDTIDFTTKTVVNILVDTCSKIPKNDAKNDADSSFCDRLSTAQSTDQPAPSSSVLKHEEVHGKDFGTEGQSGSLQDYSTSPESKVSINNSITTASVTTVESRSEQKLDSAEADLAAESSNDQAQLSYTAEARKLRQKPLEEKVIDCQTFIDTVLSSGSDDRRIVVDSSGAVSQMYSFSIVKESDAVDKAERSSDDHQDHKKDHTYGSKFGTEWTESSNQIFFPQSDTRKDNHLEGCGHTAANLHNDKTNLKQTIIDGYNGQKLVQDSDVSENCDHPPFLSSSAKIESLDATTVQPPARTDNQRKPDISISNDKKDLMKGKSLLQEAIECLAESNLIYLLADLRLLSATGRIYTPYESINIDSDFIPKESVATITASPSSPLFLSGPKTVRTILKGISSAHIIAVLLIELRKEFDFASRNDNDSTRGDSLFSALKDLVGHNQHRKHMISSMLWYSDMITKDLLHKVPQIRSKALRSHTNITKSTILERWQTMVQHNKDAISSFFPVRHAPANTAESGGNFDHNSFNEVPHEGRPSLSPRVNSAPIDRFSRTRLLRSSRKVARSILSNVQEKISDMKDENTKEKRQLRNLLNDFFDLGVDYTLSEEELLDFMEKAVMSRMHDRFQFLSEFFQEDTITRAMVESKSKVVWLQDWYPLKELTYSVSVNQEKKRVFVVFRGCTTVSDWKHALDARWKTTLNPVKEDFRGKKEKIKLHRGFFMYLFRSRKDNDTCKYDEIANVTHWYGKQIGDDYEVVATGHSLGAAMATLFSFYASTDARFTRRGPVKCITFASPMLGGQAFADTFRHQERSKKLMLARFHNASDMCTLVRLRSLSLDNTFEYIYFFKAFPFPLFYVLVTRLPPNLRFSSRGASFVHTGVGVRLTRRYVKLIWIPEERFLKSYGRALGGFFLFHTAPGQIDSQHQLACHHKRILKFQKKYKNSTASDWTLEDIYSIVFGDVKALHEGCSFKMYFPSPRV